MVMRIGDIKPGQLYTMYDNLTQQYITYLKLRDQKSVNLGTYALVNPNQQEEADVLPLTLSTQRKV